jgi:hypothetical protein
MDAETGQKDVSGIMQERLLWVMKPELTFSNLFEKTVI